MGAMGGGGGAAGSHTSSPPPPVPSCPLLLQVAGIIIDSGPCKLTDKLAARCGRFGRGVAAPGGAWGSPIPDAYGTYPLLSHAVLPHTQGCRGCHYGPPRGRCRPAHPVFFITLIVFSPHWWRPGLSVAAARRGILPLLAQPAGVQAAGGGGA